MNPTVEITEAGVLNAVQDAGRTGHRSIGVPLAGAADALLLACANRLLGNADGEAGIEMPLAGPGLRCIAGPVGVALAGAVQAQVLRADGTHEQLAAMHSATLMPGDQLRVAAVRTGLAYLALSGGCRVPLQLGSRSTYARAGLGGVEGRALRSGDRIACGPPAGRPFEETRAEAFAHDEGPIRVMPGPQLDAFDAQALPTLLGSAYRVGRDSDRMGMRLEGPTLTHRTAADITSEGVVPGAIQVPASGQPIVLLRDAQTVGGYTKIATVIRADLPRLAHLRPGSELRFAAVTRAEALAAWQHQRASLLRWAATITRHRPPGSFDAEQLLAANLVSGMIDAHEGTLPWEKA